MGRRITENVDVMKERTKRLSKEFADNYVDETLEAYEVDEMPGAVRGAS